MALEVDGLGVNGEWAGMGEASGPSIWQGATVRLRAVEPADWEAFHGFNLDDADTRGLYHVPFPQSTAAARRWTEIEAARGPDGDAFRFVIEDRGGALVGSIATHSCDRRAGTFGYGIHIAAPARRRGHATQAVAIVLRYYFEELGYQKAHVHVHAFNAASVALHEGLGFRLEGRLRRMVFSQGRHHDVLAYGLTAEEFAERRGRPIEMSIGVSSGQGPSG